jgi:phosphoglycerol transferase MdoB-like AlkP superfamily enzyme
MLMFNLIDIIYFQYTGKRSGWELLEMLYRSNDTAGMVPVYIVQYWYLILILFVFIFIQIRFYPKYKQLNFQVTKTFINNKILTYFLATLLLAFGFILARGIEIKPIRLITANRYVSPNYIPLLLNTPFTILNTINQKSEKTENYFSSDEISQYFSPVHHPVETEEFKKKNIVIIILESFGKEYVSSKSKTGEKFTPFLDSLEKAGLYCSNAFANAKRSIDAMPPILGGFPSLLHTSFLGSAYSINTLRGLPAILKEYNYVSAFYHGGKNGTMGFDMFCKSIHFDAYYGRKEYNNDDDYDGGWGIWDEEFLQYMANNINQSPEPFLSVVFTLSSHEPYPIPERYKDKFFPGEPKILRSVAYTDYALRKFFETCSKMNWYKNTLFVLCPDHTSVVIDSHYNASPARVSIPIIYFCPSDSTLHGNYDKVTQQLDIMPSILDYLKYPHSYVSYGKSIFESGYRFSISFNDVNYQIIDSSYCLLFDGEKRIRVNTYNKENLIASKNITNDSSDVQKQLENYLKAYLQDYYFRLNKNFLADTIDTPESKN